MGAKKRGSLKIYMSRYWTLYLLLLVPVIYFIVFRYGPIPNILVAFKSYSIRLASNVFAMKWADDYGFEYFIKAFANRDFINALRNTLTLNLLDLLLGFPAPIILALLLNELPFPRFKRVTQTIAYMPHFLSWVIIATLATQIFALNSGLINMALTDLNMNPIPFLNEDIHWIFTYVFVGIWQNIGWGTIIYLAAITSINPELYESASVDGASRLRKMWHITLPGIRSTVVMLLILSVGNILGSNFDRPSTMQNSLVRGVSDVISIFVYNYGVKGSQPSLAAAVGLFQSVVGLFFLMGANVLANRFGERGLW
jgi:putative aldouronate transport system permease protein